MERAFNVTKIHHLYKLSNSLARNLNGCTIGVSVFSSTLLTGYMPHSILILNGPNLNLLGTREPNLYGSQTLQDIERIYQPKAKELGIQCTWLQSNTEGDLIEWIQQASKTHQGIIINAGAYTHTSVAIRDALLAAALPTIEVHISNIFKREEFRHHSYISDIATGLICGLGIQGYGLAIEAMALLIS